MGDPDLDDRIQAAIAYGVDFEGWAELHNPEEMGRARHWLSAAIWNVRSGLLPHLFAPKLFPRSRKAERRFPKFNELIELGPWVAEMDERVGALFEWRKKQQKPTKQEKREE